MSSSATCRAPPPVVGRVGRGRVGRRRPKLAVGHGVLPLAGVTSTSHAYHDLLLARAALLRTTRDTTEVNRAGDTNRDCLCRGPLGLQDHAIRCQELAQERPKPLRERVDDSGFRCLARLTMATSMTPPQGTPALPAMAGDDADGEQRGRDRAARPRQSSAAETEQRGRRQSAPTASRNGHDRCGSPRATAGAGANAWRAHGRGGGRTAVGAGGRPLGRASGR